VQIELSGRLFLLLAVLIAAAQHDAATGSSAQGFRTAKELVALLKRELPPSHSIHRQPPDETQITRYVHRLRAKLTAAVPQGKSGESWAKRFLETGPLGYRLSTPAANLHLAMVDDAVEEGEGSNLESMWHLSRS
jgi:hypothetical protein